MSAPTPLLDFFKRGEVARDVRLLAAEGAFAPRAHEQLGIIVLLLEDPDPEIRAVADRTLSNIPEEALRAFLARSDVPIGLREFFADRGVFPSETPPILVDDPLVDASPSEDAGVEDEEAERESVVQRLNNMGFSERLKAAVKGSREVRSILIRDPNKMIAASVLASPKLTESEVEAISRMTNVSEDVLRTIGMNRAWIKNYTVVLGLAKNPKTPVGMSMNFLSRLNAKDLTLLSTDRNVPEALRVAARKKASAAAQKG
jgi:hypothetical protein